MEWDAGKADMLDGPERERDMPAGRVADLLSGASTMDELREPGSHLGWPLLSTKSRSRLQP